MTLANPKPRTLNLTTSQFVQGMSMLLSGRYSKKLLDHASAYGPLCTGPQASCSKVGMEYQNSGAVLGILYTFWVYGIPYNSVKRILFSFWGNVGQEFVWLSHTAICVMQSTIRACGAYSRAHDRVKSMLQYLCHSAQELRAFLQSSLDTLKSTRTLAFRFLRSIVDSPEP